MNGIVTVRSVGCPCNMLTIDLTAGETFCLTSARPFSTKLTAN